jgi:hypothetical protein
MAAPWAVELRTGCIAWHRQKNSILIRIQALARQRLSPRTAYMQIDRHIISADEGNPKTSALKAQDRRLHQILRTPVPPRRPTSRTDPLPVLQISGKRSSDRPAEGGATSLAMKKGLDGMSMMDCMQVSNLCHT